MINEKEIRTGNIYATIRNHEILVKGFDTVNKFVIVDPIDPNMEITSKNSNTIIFEDLNPVELTEERLLTLGFLKESSTSLKIVSEKGATFEWDQENSQIVLLDCQKGVIGQSFKYLHQFQNAYYYITGKDLPLV